MARMATGAELPPPVRHYLGIAFRADPPSVQTVVLEGHGRVRIGRLPRLPIRARMYHRPGRDYVGLIQVRVAGLPVLHVVDAFVEGAGITKIGPMTSIGPEIDQGAYLGMWPLPAAYPSAWTDGVAWEPVDDTAAQLRLPFADGVEVATVHFDPASGYPVRFEADRFKGASGRKVRWIGGSADWRLIDGIPVPGRITAEWSDEQGPWFELQIDRAQVDVPIDEALSKGRSAITAARHKEARSA